MSHLTQLAAILPDVDELEHRGGNHYRGLTRDGDHVVYVATDDDGTPVCAPRR